MIDNKTRCADIDCLYAIGTILVVFGHSHYSDWHLFSGTALDTAIQFIYGFHMPLFFFIAGFLLLRSRNFLVQPFCAWIWNKTIKLMTPYTVLFLMVIFPKYYFEHGNFCGLERHVLDCIFYPRLSVWGHFWFLPVLLLCYVIFGFLGKVYLNKKSIWRLLFVVAGSTILYFFSTETKFLGLNDFSKYAVFFSVGMLVSQELQIQLNLNNRTRTFACSVLFLAALSLFHFYSDHKIAMLFFPFMMIGVLWALPARVGTSPISTWISKNSFTIYIYSWPAQAVMMAVCAAGNINWKMTSVLMFFTGLLVPCVIVAGYHKFDRIHNRFFDLVLGMK